VTNFYSDRVIGPVPRTNDLLPELTAKGLVSLVETKKDQEVVRSAVSLVVW
jgi:hypothetical protein